MKTFEEYNLAAQEYVRELNRTLDFKQVKIFESLEAEKHYTFVAMLPAELSIRIYPVAQNLHKIDDSLILNDPALYHATIFWSPLDSPIQDIKSIIIAEIAKGHLVFEIKQLILGHGGISVKIYSTTETFLNIRKRVYDLVGKEFTGHEMEVSTWVNIARYSKSPKEEVREYIVRNQDLYFGLFIPESIGLYTSTHKNFVGAEKIGKIPNS